MHKILLAVFVFSITSLHANFLVSEKEDALVWHEGHRHYLEVDGHIFEFGPFVHIPCCPCFFEDE